MLESPNRGGYNVVWSNRFDRPECARAPVEAEAAKRHTYVHVRSSYLNILKQSLLGLGDQDQPLQKYCTSCIILISQCTQQESRGCCGGAGSCDNR